MRNIFITQIEYLIWQNQIVNTNDSDPQLSCSEVTKTVFVEVSWTTLQHSPCSQENKSRQITSFLLPKHALNSPKIIIKVKRQQNYHYKCATQQGNQCTLYIKTIRFYFSHIYNKGHIYFTKTKVSINLQPLLQRTCKLSNPR